MQTASLQDVNTHYGTHPVLMGVSFKISSGQKLGLIGANGSGKTTILRVLLGQEPPTAGSAVVSPGVKVGYVPQHTEPDEDATVTDWLLAEQRDLLADLQREEARLARSTGAETNRVMRSYQRARDSYDRVDGDTWPQRAQAMLTAFGLEGRNDQRVGSLSGGEKNVLSMAQALLAEPEILLLDEPGNHLDYLGIAWLEDFLTRFKGAVLMVSHNRYLLDRVVSGILSLENGRVRYYDGGYSTYRATRLREAMAQRSDYIANQKRLAQLEALVKRFEQIARAHSDPAWGKRLRARRSQLAREKKQAVEKPVLDESAIDADFTTEATRANIALQVRGYQKRFGELSLFEEADLDVSSGERVALVGPNGSGKTTLLRDVIANGAWENQVIRVGPSMKVGYAAQEQEVLGRDRTILEEIRASAPMSSNDAFALLRKFLFTWDDLDKRVRELSGGERNRLQLARLMSMKPNFLILDEPTNHLDIPTREAVEEALDEYQGTILVVSHDRYFLDKVVNRVVEVQDRALVSHDGNFTDFWRARQQATPRVTGRVASRGRTRVRARAERAGRRAAVASLEKRIDEAEEQRLEQQVTEAFSGRDHRQGRRANRQLVAQVVGQHKQPQPHLVSNEPVTREPRPVQGVFTFLDPLLGRAPPVVEVGYAFRR